MEQSQRLFRPREDPFASVPPPPPAPPPRSRRDTLVGAALAAVASAWVLNAIASLLQLLESIDDESTPTATAVATLFGLVAGCLLVAAFGLAARAVLGPVDGRYSRLYRAVEVSALALVVSVAGLVIQLISDVSEDIPRSGIAGEIGGIAGEVAFAASALLVAMAFVVRADGGDRAAQDERLGRASVFFAAGWVGSAIESTLFAVFFSDVGDLLGTDAADPVARALLVIGAGAVISIGGAGLAAAAFLASERDWTRLFLAAVFLAAGQVVVAFGSAIAAASIGDLGYADRDVAAQWLNAGATLVVASAFACAAVAFAGSRRA